MCLYAVDATFGHCLQVHPVGGIDILIVLEQCVGPQSHTRGSESPGGHPVTQFGEVVGSRRHGHCHTPPLAGTVDDGGDFCVYSLGTKVSDFSGENGKVLVDDFELRFVCNLFLG